MARHVRRSPVTLVGLLAALASACMLEPLPIGPGDEAADELGSEADADADTSSSESDASTSDDSVTDTSTSSESDTDSSGESDTSGESEADTSETDETDETGDGDGDCQPTLAEGAGACESLLGFAWTGTGCAPLEGCSCDGPDCPEMFESELECWLANQACAPSPCAGLDEQACNDSAPLCSPRMANPLVMDVDHFCLGGSVFAGCGLSLTCAQVISYACPITQPDAVHEFSTACLPELDWVACMPPDEPLEPC